MQFKIDIGVWNSVFAVPSKVVDEGLKFSDGAKLRVLLYILRNADRQLNDDEISKATNVSVTDVPEAIEYWIRIGVFNSCDGVLTANKGENAVRIRSDATNMRGDRLKPAENSVKTAESAEKKRFAVTRPAKPDFVFTAQRLAVDEELKVLVEETQATLGKTLSNADISTLLMLKDTCGLPVDVIFMLIHYCESIDKGNIRTIEKIGVDWADNGIYSIEAADNRIKQIRRTGSNFAVVSKAFGLKNIGSPTKKQLDYGDKWVGDWKFSPEMLREAYERCVDTKGTLKFNYIDGILKRWFSNNIRTLDELREFEKSSSKSADKNNSSFDIDELDKIDTLDDI